MKDHIKGSLPLEKFQGWEDATKVPQNKFVPKEFDFPLTQTFKLLRGGIECCLFRQSQKTVKDKVWLLKRLTRTMQNEWKKYDRIMKEQSKRAEREAEEQRKIDKEILEVISEDEE